MAYLPWPHSVQGPPLAPDVPALQVQADRSVLAGSEMESLGQSSQAALPRAALYVSGLHCAHGPPSGPEKPALQTHAALPSAAL